MAVVMFQNNGHVLRRYAKYIAVLYIDHSYQSTTIQDTLVPIAHELMLHCTPSKPRQSEKAYGSIEYRSEGAASCSLTGSCAWLEIVLIIRNILGNNVTTELNGNCGID